MTFGSLFSGCGGFDLGLGSAGMDCEWQCEIDRQCRSVLARHWPDVTCYDDARRVLAYLETKNAKRFATKPIRPDWLCGGFPCQDLSVAGKRAGLAGSRSGLWFVFRRIAALVRPRGVLIENVDGLRSSNGGKDLGVILWALGNMGYGWAYRVLDSQWFGLAQRRERMFIVGCLGSRTRAAEILFESDCMPWHPAPSRTARERVAASLTRGSASGRGVNEPGRRREDDVNLAYCLNAKGGSGRIDGESETFIPVAAAITTKPYADNESHESRLVVAHTLRSEGFDASEDGTGRGTPLVFDERNITSKSNRSKVEVGRECHTLHESPPTIAYQCQGSNVGEMGTLRAGNGNETGGVPFVMQERMESLNPNCGPNGKGWSDEGVAFTLESRNKPQSVASTFGVRRLTPRECERLQGFPDDWTRWDADGNELADSPRYRMMGNAVSVPVIEWIGRRIMEAA